jgi:hypothetical protein
VYVFSLQLLCEKFLILKIIEWNMIKKCMLVFMWHTLYFWQILMKLNFFNRFSKNTEIPNFMKIRPVGSILFNVDRQAGITKLIFTVLQTHLKKSFHHSGETCCLPYPAHSMPEMLVPMYQITWWYVIEDCNVNVAMRGLNLREASFCSVKRKVRNYVMYILVKYAYIPFEKNKTPGSVQ